MLFGEKKLVAIDIGTSSIKLAEIDGSRTGYKLTKFLVHPLPPGAVNGGEIVDATAVGQCIDALIKSAKSKRKAATVGLWGASVIIKKISMPKMEAGLVAEQVKWEAEQYIPFDVNEISLEHHILSNRSGASESMEVLLCAAKQEFLFRVMETLEIGGLKCAVVDVAGFALANCFEANYGVVDGTVALVNIGAGATNLVVVDNGDVIFCRDVGVGGLTYTNEVSKAMGVSMGEAESLKISAALGQEVPNEVHTVLTSTNDIVIDELRNTFEFFSATSGGATIQKIYISGGSIFVPGLIDQLSKTVNLPYEVMDPFSRITHDRSLTPEYIAQIKAISPIALGLAMRKVNER